MPIDLGDPLPIQNIEVRNAAGALANAGAMTLTIYLPDGSSTPGTFTNPTAGSYVPDVYVTAQVGRHVIRWVGTGLNAASYTEAFDVRPALAEGIMSLADAKQHLNITGTGQDEELRLYIDAVSTVVENYIGPVGRRTVTDRRLDVQSGLLLLRTTPILSVTSVTPATGSPYTVTSADFDPVSGIVYPPSGTAFYGGPFTVVYVVGRAEIPADVSLAARMVLGRAWETQRGAAELPLAADTTEGAVAESFAYLKSYGVLEMLNPYRPAPAVA